MGGASWVGRGLGKVGGGDTQEGRGGVSRIGRDLRRNGWEETTTRGGASGKWAGHPEDRDRASGMSRSFRSKILEDLLCGGASREVGGTSRMGGSPREARVGGSSGMGRGF